MVALLSSFFVAWALWGVLPAVAGERVHFKNGHLLEVISSRTEGPMVFLTLPDKSEIGVPASLIAQIEGGRDVPIAGAQQVGNFSGRGPALTDLIGYKQAMAQQGQRFVGEATAQRLSQIRQGSPNQPMTFGFAFRGSSDVTAMTPNRGPQESATNRAGPTDGSPMQWGAASAAVQGVRPGSLQPQKTDPNPQNGPP